MDPLKQHLERQLIANVLIDKCSQAEGLVFRDAWCTQDRVIRFTTPFLRALFSVTESTKGKWKTGDAVMYEVHNDPDDFVVDCVFNATALTYTQHEGEKRLFAALQKPPVEEMTLKSWPLAGQDSLEDLFAAFDRLINQDIPAFEQELDGQLKKQTKESAVMTEGEEIIVISKKYERNPKARAACLAAHGTACAVCGIDFGKAYGPEFAGEIEVHHIRPLYTIREEYVLDPVKDLIPVCPNCHRALHRKAGGVYTVEELKALRERI